MQISEMRAPAALAPGTRLGVIGAGAMGGALVRGVLASGVALDAVWAATKSAASARAIANEFGVSAYTTYSELTPSSDIVLLAVKPAQVEGALRELVRAGLRSDTLVISVAAGISIERIEAQLPQANPVVRAMPNTPAFVGRGMTAIAGGTHATKDHLAIAERLFGAVGMCLTIEERLLNAVTAISGSGPAYVYLIIEALADAGVRVGLPRDVAMTLVTQTVLGAAVMVQESDRHPAALRDDVTTPAGCTIGALLVLEDGKIRSVLARAVEEARNVLEGRGQ
ncbi:MAG: pyrroline-5-carboxylate reductase [Candidatus Lustribacter sp.]